MHRRRYWIYSRPHTLYSYSIHCMCSVYVYMISHDVNFSLVLLDTCPKKVASSRRNVLRVAPPTPWCVDFGGVVVQCFKEKKAQATQAVDENPEKHFEPINDHSSVCFALRNWGFQHWRCWSRKRFKGIEKKKKLKNEHLSELVYTCLFARSLHKTVRVDDSSFSYLLHPFTSRKGEWHQTTNPSDS